METGTKLSATFLTQAQRRHQSGAVIFEVRMPDLALFALFDQGDGPLKVIRGKAGGIGGKVIISNFGSFAELWGQSIFA